MIENEFLSLTKGKRVGVIKTRSDFSGIALFDVFSTTHSTFRSTPFWSHLLGGTWLLLSRGCLLLSCLGLHDNLLEGDLEALHQVRLVRELALELDLKGFETRNLFLDEVDTLLDVLFALEDTLLGEDGTDHFEDVCIVVEHFELSHHHLVLTLLLNHLLLVHDHFFVLYRGGTKRRISQVCECEAE